VLLVGYIGHDDRGLPRQKYFEPNGKEDQDARRAFARLLRAGQPLDRRLQHALANLFDPLPDDDQRSDDPTPTCERRLVFAFIDGRGKIDNFTNSKIAQRVNERVWKGKNVSEAVEKTAEEFSLSERHVWEKWKTHKWLFRTPRGRRRPNRIGK
jgi:hypothetical protein